jgi:hypothetical protein
MTAYELETWRALLKRCTGVATQLARLARFQQNLAHEAEAELVDLETGLVALTHLVQERAIQTDVDERRRPAPLTSRTETIDHGVPVTRLDITGQPRDQRRERPQLSGRWHDGRRAETTLKGSACSSTG